MAKASAAAVWTAWSDVDGESAYDHVKSARVDGAFQPGAVITTKLKGVPRSNLTVTGVEPPSLWVDASRSPGMRMTVDHVLDSSEGGRPRASLAGPGQSDSLL